MKPDDEFWRAAEVKKRIGNVSNSSLYELMDLPPEDDPFPKPFPISKRRVAWLSSEVHAWMERRVAARDQSLKDRAKKRLKRKPAAKAIEEEATA